MERTKSKSKGFYMVPVSLFLSFLLLLPSCNREIGAYDCISDFAAVWGGGGTVYSPSVKEGEPGYTDGDFFETLFGEGYEAPENYAVLLLPYPDRVGECGLFVCETRYRQSEAIEFCEHRLSLLRSFGFAEDESVKEAKIFCVNGCVFYCALPDGERAEKILRSLL